jgi:hypothetical protein
MSNIAKHIAHKLFYPHELHSGKINIFQLKSFGNVTEFFTKSLGALLHLRNVFVELISGGFKICKHPREYLHVLQHIRTLYYTLFPFVSLLSWSSRF